MISIINSAVRPLVRLTAPPCHRRQRQNPSCHRSCSSRLHQTMIQWRRGANRADAIRIDYGRHARPAATSHLSASWPGRPPTSLWLILHRLSLHTQPNDYARWTCDLELVYVNSALRPLCIGCSAKGLYLKRGGVRWLHFDSGVAIGCAECARHTGPRPPGAHRRHTLTFCTYTYRK